MQTTEEVEKFVKEVEPLFTKYKHSKYRMLSTEDLAYKLNCNGIFEQWGIKNWEKTDINNDGKTDLLFIISSKNGDPYTFLIIDKGLKGFKNISLSKNSFEKCELFKPTQIGENVYLKSYILKQKEIGLMEYEEFVVNDTLTFKFDEIVEKQENPAKYKIKAIEYSTGCSDGCPVFSFKMKSDGTAYYNGKYYAEVHGARTLKINQTKFKEMEKLLGYIRVKELNDKYNVPWFHAKTGFLRITFSDNTQKTINDYGSIGTFGLSAVYTKIEDIVRNEIWN
ncbi:DUF6438 domain-containing protein [Salinimicrobium sp. GXAS 041]|uniref:DUF6438 domain-containing protein n=1 Tax=Salinimicrobium sp. GXAS 041 TaxID=3400806 RepID=UPI003C71540A